MIDRLSFQWFLGISFDTEIPAFSTIWRFQDWLIKAELYDKISTDVLDEFERRNLILQKGTLIDVSIMQVACKPRKKQESITELPAKSPTGPRCNRHQKRQHAVLWI